MPVAAEKGTHMLDWLFPDQRKFYTRFSGVAHHLTAAATLLEQAFDRPALWPELSASIENVDHETDAAAHDLELGAERQFIPPMDREDIHLLSSRLRRVVDIIGGTARRVVSLRATERKEPAVALAHDLVVATGEIEAAVDHLRNSDEVLAHCREIKRMEEQGDEVWEVAVTELFASSRGALDILRWKTIYDQLEEALDACEDVANELETITVKHM
jgi:uncharacterized protein Yka (UPF0111/DUF47 family)